MKQERQVRLHEQWFSTGEERWAEHTSGRIRLLSEENKEKQAPMAQCMGRHWWMNKQYPESEEFFLL